MADIIAEMEKGNLQPTKIVKALEDKGRAKATVERVLDEIRRDLAPTHPFFRCLIK